MKIILFYAVFLVVFTTRVHAVDLSNITFNGFGSIVGSKVLSGSVNEPEYLEKMTCPCFITDYNTGGFLTEETDFSLKNESRIGIQMGIEMTQSLSFTTQLVARAITNEFSLEWAFGTYKINDSWQFQFGRKRIPLYYFSTFQDVGLAYSWVRPPQALYGWEASNYNGVNLVYKTNIQFLDLSASIYAGNETVDDAGFNNLYYDDKQDSRWENIRGFDFEATYEWFNARIVYLTSDNSVTDKPIDNKFYSPPTKQTVVGLAINVDLDDPDYP